MELVHGCYKKKDEWGIKRRMAGSAESFSFETGFGFLYFWCINFQYVQGKKKPSSSFLLFSTTHEDEGGYTLFVLVGKYILDIWRTLTILEAMENNQELTWPVLVKGNGMNICKTSHAPNLVWVGKQRTQRKTQGNEKRNLNEELPPSFSGISCSSPAVHYSDN